MTRRCLSRDPPGVGAEDTRVPLAGDPSGHIRSSSTPSLVHSQSSDSEQNICNSLLWCSYSWGEGCVFCVTLGHVKPCWKGTEVAKSQVWTWGRGRAAMGLVGFCWVCWCVQLLQGAQAGARAQYSGFAPACNLRKVLVVGEEPCCRSI